MEQKNHYTQCPLCGSEQLREVFRVIDSTVSGELFPVIECSSCSLRFTQDVPAPDEIGKYYKSEDYISHTNTSRGLINRLYQAVRRRTIRKKYRLIKRKTGKNAGSLLDLGSGTGTFAKYMIDRHWEVTALEPDAEARQKGKELYGIELKDLPVLYELPAERYDAITLWHVLEHVHELRNCVEQLKKLLKPGGRIFIAVPNYTSKDAFIYEQYWAAYDVPRHLYHFSPDSMKLLLESCGLQIESYEPMWYDSFYISMLSSKYKHGHSRLFSAFWSGLRSNLAALGNVKRCSSVIYVAGRDH